MSFTKHAASYGPISILYLVLSGCGGSDTASSSTSDTLQPPPAGSANHAPTASISAPQSFQSGAPVTLDGSGSSDPDGDELQFSWTQTQGPAIPLTATSNAALVFVAPVVSQASVFAFSLTVTDGELAASTEFSLLIQPSDGGNQPPAALISGERSFISGQTVTLDGSGSSDPDGDALQFSWTQTQGPAIPLSGSANSELVFVAPTLGQPTEFGFQLTVDDGALADSAAFTLQVLPLTDTTPPSVNNSSPAPGQSGVAVDTQIIVTFDEALLPGSVDASSLVLSEGAHEVAGSISYDEANHSITFTPDTPLAEGTAYNVTLGANIADLAGNPAPAESWSFTTETGGYNLGATTPETIALCMDAEDMQMLTLVNNTRVQDRLCGTTSYPAVSPLAWDCLLETAAQNHSASMANNDYFSHTGIDGSSPGDRITAVGYSWRTYGENIAAGYADAQSVMEGWIASSGHCANLMNAGFTQIGVAKFFNESSFYNIYWTQDFATPR